MNILGTKKAGLALMMAALAVMNLILPSSLVFAADHAEATIAGEDPGADIGDTYIFLNPNDNTRVVLAMTVAGFIVPSELMNLGFFPSGVMYRFEIENTGDPAPDRFIDVVFSQQTSRSSPQTATIYPTGIANKSNRFSAPTTVSNFNGTPAPFVVTTNAGVSFFAGMTDDPFYFDIVATNRFTSSILAGAADATRLNRSRDSFAGYSIHSIALEFPVSALTGSAGSVIGVNGVTLRSRRGNFVQVDRMATPAVNTLLIPYPRKNEFNSATTVDDAAGRFAGDIVASLTALGTNSANIGVLASVAVANGDILRLNTATPNTSQGFGERATTPGYTGFPNGRRFGDDTVDVLLYFVSNFALTIGDNVNSNDIPLTNTFPFLGVPHAPLENPAVDLTRN